LLKTIDATIKHLKGKKKMKDKEMFDGFNIALVKAKTGQSYSAAEEIAFRSAKSPTRSAEDVAKRGKDYYDNLTKAAHALFEELVHCIKKGVDPTDDEVQKIIKRHHAFMEKTHTATKEVYQAYAQLYAEHPEFRKQLDPFHPKLAKFMAEAMRVFADTQLS
jgi:hypothetical protein